MSPPCLQSGRGPTRIAEVACRRLVEKSSGSPEPLQSVAESAGSEVAVTSTADGVTLRVGGETVELDRADTERLREALGDALVREREFLHTVGRHREDGSYVVARRGADSAGHRKVFDSFAELGRLYRRLPSEFTAADAGETGLSGGRRHMVVRHFAEHPAFDCELASEQPLTGRKRGECEGGE